MPVNPAYRGFLKALDAIAQGADPWSAYQRHYLGPQRAKVLAYWRQVWGIEEERLRQVIADLRPGDYASLQHTLQRDVGTPTGEDVPTAEALAAEAVARCAPLIGLPEPQVDLLIGRFSPDAFLFEVAGQWHIGVGLERFAEFSLLPLLVAHEYGHYARRLLAPEPATLADRLVAEGIAVAFAQVAYPEQPLTRHLRMTPRRLHEIAELKPELWAALRPHLDAPYSDAFAGIVSGGRRWRDYPPRFGCHLGYMAVRAFARMHGLSPAGREVLAAPASIVLVAGPAARSAR
ncbi:MAG TPA: DUF2268 domain-containing putative Zn-dependent protease [Armatimonadota bacterium]|nr:DUF2268 domain-containing putative Zn-dependent protease [Armatimonadota bacterium]